MHSAVREISSRKISEGRHKPEAEVFSRTLNELLTKCEMLKFIITINYKVLQ